MVSTMMSICSTESKIIGKWVIENGMPVADASAKRIYHLVESELIELGRSDDGWSVLYMDKADGRYWELSYPDSGELGGGAPCLEVLSHNDAVRKFKIQI